jgi:outer membrane protein assembly factor BamB
LVKSIIGIVLAALVLLFVLWLVFGLGIFSGPTYGVIAPSACLNDTNVLSNYQTLSSPMSSNDLSTLYSDEEALRTPGYSPPEAMNAINNSTAFILNITDGAQTGNVYALDENTGNVVWSSPVCGAYGSVVLTNGKLFVLTGQWVSQSLGRTAHLYAFNTSNGALLWKRIVGIDLELVGVVNNTLVGGYNNGEYLVGINESTGNLEWTYTLPEFNKASDNTTS